MRTFLYLLLLIALCTSGLAAESAEPFFRVPNITIFYPKIPWELLGVTPKFENPQMFRYDLAVPAREPPRLDPRTCPGEIALCYQVLEHNYTGEITAGKNYSATSTYVLPERRVKTVVCVGDDLECVAQSTNCYCPSQQIDPAPYILKGLGTCSDSSHLCRNSYASFTLCEGNLSWCNEQHIVCGCGKYGTCTAGKVNTCVNDRNELFVCAGTLAECVTKYESCFCGTEILSIQEGCQSPAHVCRTAGFETLCYGTLAQCALKFDVCEC